MIEEIREKIDSGYYFNNTLFNDEFSYIVRVGSLKNAFLDSFASKKMNLLTFDSGTSIVKFEKILLDYVKNLDKERQKNALINLVLSDLKSEFSFNYLMIDNHPDEFDFSDEENEEINNYILNYALDPKNNVYFEESDDVLKLLLDNKKYDLLNRVRLTVNPISKSIKDRLNKEFPFDEYELPLVLTLRNDCYKIDGVSDEQLLKAFDGIPKNHIKRNKKLLKVFLDLLERVSEKYDNSNTKIYKLFDHVFTFSGLVETKKSLDFIDKNLLIKLINKGFINNNIYKYMLDNSYMTVDQLNKYLIDNYENSNMKDSYFDQYGNFTYSSGNAITFSEMIELQESLIDRGYGLVLLQYCRNIYEEELNEIENQIKNGNNKIDHLKFMYVNDEIIKNKYLLNYILNNIKIDTLEFCLTNEYDPNNNNLFKNYILDNEVIPHNLPFYDEEILNFILNKKEYQALSINYFNYSTKNKNNFFKYEMLNWIKQLPDNYFLIEYLLSSCWNDFDIIKLALSIDYFCEDALNQIIHNYSPELIDKETFDISKEYCSSKYNLNLENMELLAKNFGPKIILHYNDDNLQKIINLPNEELNKIINIFPMNYNLVDIEAAYESIMQYAFKQDNNNLDIINIFTNLKDAIVDENIEKIEKNKYMLMSYVDINYYNEIKNQYDALKDFNLEKCIDFLSKNFSDEKYRDILHSLTNNAIIMARKYYVNDNYYKKSYVFRLSKIRDDIYCLNANLQRSKENRNEQSIRFYFNKVYSSLPNNLKEKLLYKYGISDEKEIERLYNQNIENFNEYLSHYFIEELERIVINNEKIKSKKDYSIFSQLKVDYILDERSKKNEIEKHLIKTCGEYYFPEGVLEDGVITLEDVVLHRLEKKGLSHDLIYDMMNYYSRNDKFSYSYNNYIKDIQENLGTFVKEATNVVRKYYQMLVDEDPHFEENIISNLDNSDLIKRNYYTDTSKKDIYSILSLLNIDLLQENLLNSEEKYNQLVNVMSKYKPHLLPDEFSKLIEVDNIPLTSDLTDVSAFINYFPSITSKGDISDLSTSKILIQSGIYSSVNSIYSVILGTEDSKLIKSNPNPNAAYSKTRNQERLKQAVDDTVTAFERDTILIPPIDEEVEVKNYNKLRVIVGNFTAPCNLTHGERTGSCMRIGGAGERLYDFCLNNNAGFHIRFEDPKSHKYVSRVSGFRNGNTVYLNQLRYSLDTNYSEDDLVKATKQIAQELIDLTKDSKSPIENVFVTKNYAIDAQKDMKPYRLNSQIIERGLGKIYTDYGFSEAYVLATTAKNGYVPLNSGNTNVQKYKVQRSKPIVNMNVIDAASRINRVNALNQLLNGVDLSDVTTQSFEDGIIYSIVNDDWYIYVTDKYEIKADYIKGNIEAQNELNEELQTIKNKIDNKEISEVAYEL